MDNIRQFIEDKIKAYGLTKKEVAEKMGVHPANLNKMIESPSFPTLEKLSDALGVTISELLRTESENVGTGASSPSIVCPKCGTRPKLIEEEQA